MQTVLTVIEDRILLRQVESYFAELPEFYFRFTLRSCHAFHYFIDARPQLVIIDATITTAYQVVLKEFSQVCWPYRVLLLVDHDGQKVQGDNIVNLHKRDLSKTRVLQEAFAFAGHLKESNQASSFSTFSAFSPQLGRTNAFITILYARSTENLEGSLDKNRLHTLNDVISSYCTVESIGAEGRDLFVVVDTATVPQDMAFEKIAELIFSHVSAKYAVYIHQRIYYGDLARLYEQIDTMNALSYFYQEQVVDLAELAHPCDVKYTFEQVDVRISELIALIFNNQLEEYQGKLNALFEDIKQARSLLLAAYVRCMLACIYNSLSVLTHKIGSKGHFQALSYQEEVYLWSMAFDELGEQLMQQTIPLALEQMVGYVFCHFSQDISLEQVAGHFKITKNYVSRLFKEQFSMTFLDFLQGLKLEKAKFLLSHTKLQVQEISTAIGYGDAHYFSRLFKKRMNCAPLHYRALKKVSPCSSEVLK